MQENTIHDNSAAARQLRPVVITVVAANLAVFALLMTTINLPTPMSASMPAAIEMAAAR